MEQYVYHFKPKEMTGSTLIPLNHLQATHPEIYSEHIKKYKNREQLLQKRVPILNCLWNDVLHLSPINPQIIIDTWRSEGLIGHAGISKSFEVYKIPAKKLREENTICYQSFNYDFENYNPDQEKNWRFIQEKYIELKVVGTEQLSVWHNDMKAGRPFFWYSHTMHVLAEQNIDITGCDIITCQ